MTNILNTNFNTLYIFAGMVLLEFIVFLILVAKKKLNIIRILLAVLTGNAITTLMCLFIPSSEAGFGYYAWLGAAYVLSTVFEWLVYVGYFRNNEVRISNGYFIASAVIGNLLSFGAIFALNHYNVPV
ncbi:MAG: hypothetical protein K6F33_01905 [Bacteroidales bacterium]|nr:hypothetical protein [Bacteroidales bacterium]